MGKITYLLGAGASANSLPTVNKFEEELTEMIYGPLKEYQTLTNIHSSSSNERQKNVTYAIADLKLLLEGCKNHRSVDTFAKMLFITSNNDIQAKKYLQVKSAITLFFELHAFFSNSFDKRYDAFIATLIRTSNPRFSSDVNILSWNYDYEFERAYLKYIPHTTDIHDTHADLNIVHKRESATNRERNKFGIFKINGTSGFYGSNNKLHLGLDIPLSAARGNMNSDRPKLDQIFAQYYKLTTDPEYRSAISFSWEQDNLENIKDEIRSMISRSQTIIVIGYSFPYFNREIDKQIFEFIEYRGCKIIVQDKFAAAAIAETIGEMRNNWAPKLKSISDDGQFYMDI